MTVLLALAAGAVGGTLFGNVARPAMHMAIGCMMLNEAQKTGILDQAKSSALLDRLKDTRALNEIEKEAAANMKTVCPKLR